MSADPAGAGERGAWADFAREVIFRHLSSRDPREVPPPAAPLDPHGGVFVTLYKFRALRGCVGNLNPVLPLPEAVRDAALSACEHDPRFPRLAPSELPDVEIAVSILSPPEPLLALEQLEIGRHGIIVRRGLQRGLFLPQVALEHGLDREMFLSRCCSDKAGLPPLAWREPGTELLIFTTRVERD